MHRHLHVITDTERIIDPDGQPFADLASALAEARQCARDLMAEELRAGRSLPLAWKVQLVDSEGAIEATVKFAELVFGSHVHEGQPKRSVQDPDLTQRAKAIFFKARHNEAALRSSLRALSDNVRLLSKLTASIRHH